MFNTFSHLFKQAYQQASPQKIILLLTLLSALIAWRVNYVQHGWVNDDFVLYHEAARLFTLGNWQQGFALFGWPLYSLLISLTHQLTGLDLHLSARLLSVLFFAITSYSFMHIIQLSGGNKITIISGAVILFSSPYLTGDVLPMLLRDPGLWAFFLTSLVFFVRYYRQQSWKNALLWQFFAILAMLFRVEAITYLIFLPWVLLLHPTIALKEKVSLFLKAQSLNIGLLAILLFALLVVPSLSMRDFGRLQEVWGLFDYKYQIMLNTLTERSDLMANTVFKGHFDSLAKFGFLIALASMCLVKCITTLGWLNAVLISFNVTTIKSNISHDTQRILSAVIALSLLNIVLIVLSVFLLASRYTAPLALTLMLFASFALANLLSKAQQSAQNIFKWLAVLVLLIMSLLLIKNLSDKPTGYNYEQHAVNYLQQQKISNEQIFFVSPRARYYAGVRYAGRGYQYDDYIIAAIADGTIFKYRYLMLNLNHNDAKSQQREKMMIQQLKNYRLIKVFYRGKSQKRIAIYQRLESPASQQ